MKDAVLERIVTLLRDPATGVRLSAAEWEEAVHVLRDASLLACLCYRAEQWDVLDDYPPYARRHLRAMRTFADRQAQQVRIECDEIAATLRAQGIEPVFLKGAGYTLRDSRNARGRIYTDIDVLVRQEEIDPAQASLRQNLWYSRPLRDYDERYYRRWAHEVPPLRHLKRRTLLDLHHNIVPPISGRAPNPAHLRAAVEVTATGLLVLSPAAATLHSMVHLFTNEDFTNAFRDLIDLYLLIGEFDSDNFWQELTTLAQQTGFSLELYYALRTLQEILDMSVPMSVMQPLQQHVASARREFLVQHVFCRAAGPHHPAVCSRADSFAIQLVYLRGHWIKMPVHILTMHLSIKAWFSLVDRLFGKYQFEKPPGMWVDR